MTPDQYAVQPYLSQLAALLAGGSFPRGTVNVVQVEHDDHCDLLAGRGPCNCTPVVGGPVTPDCHP